jgi:hypothetical protein
MAQERFESLLLQQQNKTFGYLSADELVSRFAAAADRRLYLGPTFTCALLNGSRLPSHSHFVSLNGLLKWTI